MKEFAKPLGAAVRYALDSNARTARLCCILVAFGFAAGVYALVKGA